MFSKASFDNKDLEPRTAENIADTLYEIGRDLLKDKQYELSAKWLERSHGILARQDLEKLSENAGEFAVAYLENLPLVLTAELVRALLEVKTDEARDRARNLVALFENDYGDKFIVQLLKLELISVGSEFDAREYYGGSIQRGWLVRG
ncbi:hypothetical protein GP486_005081 [Trichoglossum hirsutum]|uniref:Uncharacterized protein n=1 Tax=Trichoglossum hirsutum TaxID=265104 RepID=A0A9P8L9S7_9PEZI|nr:hypothetical protein GP486_005081 [Trichoglossum hirsutum]